MERVQSQCHTLTPHLSIIPTGGTAGDGERQSVGTTRLWNWHQTGPQDTAWVKGKRMRTGVMPKWLI